MRPRALTPTSRVVVLLAVLAFLVLTAGCFQLSDDTAVSVNAEVLDAPSSNVTVVSVQNESIAGTPLESIVREAAQTGAASTTVPADRSDQVATAQDALPRQPHPGKDWIDGTYVRVDDTVVFLWIRWPG
jgi:hypothetical protein